MKILVLGCNGMLGHVVSLYFYEKGYEVIGFARKKLLPIDTIIGDANNLELMDRVIREGRFDAVVNCIGVLNQAAENNKCAAVFLNAYLPHYLSDITKKMCTKIVHISTDCVFSGKTGNYTEHSLRDGETFYDRSKALGELVDSKNITLRTSIIGPDININGAGLFNWFMKQEDSINGYTRAVWTGQTTLQLAKTIEQAIIQNATGMFNMVPKKSITKYELLKLINKLFRGGKIDIRPSEEVVLDKSLKRTNYSLKAEVPDYEIMVAEMKDWIDKHKDLYPHY